MRVTVLGSQGNLGKHLTEELFAAGHAVDAVDRQSFDLAHHEGLLSALRERFANHQSNLVINAAAYTDVDGAETHTDQAFKVNALGAEIVAKAAEQTGASLVYISTDFVFSGERPHPIRPYDEFDAPDPRSLYARSKYAGEVLCAMQSSRLYIVRVEGLYGRHGKNFVSTLASRLKAGQPLRIDRQRRVTPTWTRALAKQILTLSRSSAYGTYHATCSGETTWADFASALCEIAGELGHPLPRTFTAVDTDELKAPAPRPAYSVLACRMLSLRGLYTMPPWQTALREYLTELVHHGML